MKNLLLSFFIIFSSMNIFAHDSETLKFEDMKKIADSFMEEPALFALSEKNVTLNSLSIGFPLLPMPKILHTITEK